MLGRNKIGLIVGLFFAVIHVIWAFFVAVMPNSLQNFLDWIFQIHFLEPYWIIQNFDFVGAVFLVLMTFAFGYFFGYLFAIIWNLMHKASHKPRRTRRVRHRRRRRR